MIGEPRSFKVISPSSVSETLDLLAEHHGRAKILAGGVDVVLLLKSHSISPEVIINLDALGELSYIRLEEGDGLFIGALTSLSSIGSSEQIGREYPLMAHAVSHASTPQIRNMGTLGGNILQEVWCWYLRNGVRCWKSGDRGCPAATGDNSTYYSIMGGKYCVAACSSDLAPALLAYDAVATAQSLSKKRELKVDELLPGTKIVDGKIRSNALKDDELLTGVRVPKPEKGTLWAYERFSFRKSLDFPVVSVAVLGVPKDGRIGDCRVCLGGVAPSPYRAKNAESVIAGSDLTHLANAAESAAEVTTRDCRPLGMNKYKVEILRGLIERAIIRLGAQ
jgi:xanthine dehydrogenase YagS FAD-binding subunit